MTDYTPSIICIRNRYALWGRSANGNKWDDSMAEFDRFLAAHDQGIRDACRPAEMTAREHLEAAWEAAHPVPPDVRIPKGMEYLVRINDHATPALRRAAGDFRGSPIVRTLDPLPPVIPDDCMAVWASTRKDESRRVWVRATGSMAGLPDKWGVWDDGNRDADYALTRELIDPKPVPEEER